MEKFLKECDKVLSALEWCHQWLEAEDEKKIGKDIKRFKKALREFRLTPMPLASNERNALIQIVNTRLIAAAPDLLAACEAVLTLIATMQGMRSDPEYIEKVSKILEDAIAKAKSSE